MISQTGYRERSLVNNTKNAKEFEAARRRRAACASGGIRAAYEARKMLALLAGVPAERHDEATDKVITVHVKDGDLCAACW